MVTHTQNVPQFVESDASSDLANNRLQYIEFYHLPSDLSVAFKAFLTTFSDQYESDWTDDDAYGRMDPISAFKRTKRTISLGWNVPSASLEEAIENLQHSSLLLTMLYPDYEKSTNNNNVSTIKTSPLFRLRFMNLIQNASTPGGDAKTGGLLGKMSGLTYEPDLEQGFFDPIEFNPNDLKKGKFTAINGQLYPQTIKFQCQYTVLHDHALGWENKETRSAAFGKFPYAYSIADKESLLKKILNTSNDFSERKTAATESEIMSAR